VSSEVGFEVTRSIKKNKKNQKKKKKSKIVGQPGIDPGPIFVVNSKWLKNNPIKKICQVK